MAKWADYVITAVGFDAHNTHITEVEIRPDSGAAIGQPSRVDRTTVARAILAGTTFVTVYLRNGQWHRGEDVRAVRIGHELYLRTDANAIRADNLGNLPRLSPSTSTAWVGR